MTRIVTAALTATALLAVSPLSSQAADLAPVPRAPAFTWTGWYVGINAGYAWGDSTVSTCVNDGGAFFLAIERRSICASHSNRGLDPNAFTGGVQAGYLWQSPGQWFLGGAMVFGIEADINSFRMRDSTTVGPVVITPPPAAVVAHTVTQNMETNWLFTLRPRIGAAFSNWLVYATGGLAVTDLESHFVYSHTQFLTGSASGQAGHWVAGWTLGGGLEWAILPNWTVRAEYLYVRFDSVSGTSTNLSVLGVSVPSEVFFHNADLTANIVRGAVNFRF